MNLQYSCSELEANDPERHLRASDVSRQVQQAPNKRQRVPPPPPAPGSAPARSYLSKYPETFKDKEKTKGLQSKTPRKEYPIIPGPGNWVPGVSGTADKVRAVYNNNDRTTFDVVYHDVKKSSNAFENFSVANYRPARPQGT